VAQNWGGIENLSIIPGTVGAAPIQNIGAYGVEIKEVLESVEVLDCQDFSLHTFSNAACAFGYRDSIFKQTAQGKYLITAVTFVLQKKPVLHLTYGAIQQTLEAMQVTHPTIQDVSRAVCHIRSTKLPNPQEIGNAGSFFKNPEIDLAHYEQLKTVFPAMPSYAVANPAKVKVPAGWLIEQAGWKGVRQGNVGVHKDQALVLVNYGGAQGSEIVALASQVQAAVRAKFEIDLTPEINYI
jgi:UDP-N-acetylmuramate dehydrogenase